MTGGHYRRSTRQSGIHAHPQSTVTLLVTFVSVQTPPEFGQRVELPAVYAHFRARVGLHHFVDRTVAPLGYRLGPGSSDTKRHWEFPALYTTQLNSSPNEFICGDVS